MKNSYKGQSLQQIREEILKRKTLQDQNKVNIKRTIDRIKNSVESFDSATLEKLRDYGIHADILLNVDYDRMLEDRNYLVTFISEVKRLTEQYKEVVGTILTQG